MEPEGAMSSGTGDVTIYLVPPKLAAEEQEQGIHVPKKLKRSLDEPEAGENSSSDASSLPRLGTVRADSTRLRECSKYFETCMSERWTTGGQREFELEVQTEVRFYHDCFARMLVPFKPLASVGECLELLKVASQIDCAQVLDVSVRFLAGAPWCDKEEKSIRDFYASGQLVSSSSASDLCKRLQVPSSEEEREQRHFDLTERVLRRSLALSWSDYLHSSAGSRLRKERRRVFQETFESIVRGSGPGKRSKLLQISLFMVMEELERLMDSVKKTCQERPPSTIILVDLVSRVCWLFKLLRGANSLQGLVELVLKDQDIAPLLQITFQSFNEGAVQSTEKRWARMIGIILQGLLDGHLFLKTSERLDLFKRWNWILKDDHFEREAPLCANLVFSFILTFPQEEQEEIFCRWLSTIDDPAQRAQHCDLSKVHMMWIKHLVAKAEKLDAPKCSSTAGDSERADG